jgi:methylmalonyl-CoA mutase
MTNPLSDTSRISNAKNTQTGNMPQWLDLVTQTLRGDGFNTLEHTTEDGIKRGPLFTQGPSIHLAKSDTDHLAGRPWHLGVMIDHPQIDGANRNILDDLQGGASALSLNIDPSGKYGIAVRSITDVERLLSDVYTSLVPIYLAPSGNFETMALFVAYFERQKRRENISLSFGYVPGPQDEDQLLALANWVTKNAHNGKAFNVNGAAMHEEGASAAQELAFIAARLVSYLRILLKEHNIDTALAMIDARLAADQDAHFNIVKFRAARLIWAKIVEEFGGIHTAMPLHAISSMRMMAKEDPWANLLRLNAASFGAAVGGADVVTLLPFTHKTGHEIEMATPFARRLSRNIQLLQMEETHLGHVQDPAHGSYMHESLTHDLAEKSWEIFQDVENRGGWFKAFDWFMEQVKSTETLRAEKIKNGDIKLVGINQYVKPDVRKAKTLKRPSITKRSGEIINARDFETAVQQAKNGHLLPLNGEE